MLLFSALVAGSFALGGLIANLIDPIALTAFRFLFAAVLLSSIVMATGQFKRAYLDAPWRYFLLGASMALYFSMMFIALKTATPISTSAIFTLTPPISAIFGWFLLRQITTKWIALALTIGAIGALWAAGVHSRYADRRHDAHGHYRSPKDHRHRMVEPADDRLCLCRISDHRDNRSDFLSGAVFGPAFARVQGHGLHLSDPVFCHHMGWSFRPWIARTKSGNWCDTHRIGTGDAAQTLTTRC